jgi:electron transfer flavoprotein beta subunit
MMNIVVPVKLVPDLVEELKIDESGVCLDPDWLRLKLNEFDDHAIEEAVLLKERGLGSVTVIAPDGECVEDVLFTAAAKGADQIIKLSGDFEGKANSHALARWMAALIRELQPGLVLTGVQAHNNLDGSLGPLLAEYLGFPYVGYVAGVAIHEKQARIRKEYPGGLIAEMEVDLPAVLGIQVAEQPPRYVAFSKIRQASKTSQILEKQPEIELDNRGGANVNRLFQPQSSQRAQMIPGDAVQVADRLVEIFTELNIL